MNGGRNSGGNVGGSSGDEMYELRKELCGELGVGDVGGEVSDEASEKSSGTMMVVVVSTGRRSCHCRWVAAFGGDGEAVARGRMGVNDRGDCQQHLRYALNAI
jgi:hypothetical protein